MGPKKCGDACPEAKEGRCRGERTVFLFGAGERPAGAENTRTKVARRGLGAVACRFSHAVCPL